jgi:ribosomal-protein-alanine N-acetyltransferase
MRSWHAKGSGRLQRDLQTDHGCADVIPPDPDLMSSAGAPDAIVVERMESATDLDAVAELEARCFSNPWTREMLARELAQSDVAHVFLLRLPGQPVAAFCSCWIIADELHVNTIAVDFPNRRRGLASRLMRHVMSEARRRGAVRATLEVRRSNTAALALYESLGFSVTAVRPQYYSQPVEDALILWTDALTDG